MTFTKNDPRINRRGRPANDRALTKILKTALNVSEQYPGDDKAVTRKRHMAEMVSRAVNEGLVKFPDGRELELKLHDWLQLVQWIYRHVDGDARQEMLVETQSSTSITADEMAAAMKQLKEFDEQEAED